MIISKKDFDFIKLKPKGSNFELELTLGQGKVKVVRESEFAIIEAKFKIEFNQKIKDNFLYILDNEGLRKIEHFCSKTNNYYKLFPTGDWPTISTLPSL